MKKWDPVVFDPENLKDVKVIKNDYVTIDNNFLRHDTILLSVDIFKYLIKNK